MREGVFRICKQCTPRQAASLKRRSILGLNRLHGLKKKSTCTCECQNVKILAKHRVSDAVAGTDYHFLHMHEGTFWRKVTFILFHYMYPF